MYPTFIAVATKIFPKELMMKEILREIEMIARH